MADNYVLGMDAAAYYAQSPESELSTMTEMRNIRGDLNISMEKGEADVTTRANDGWRATASTLKSCEVTFQMLYRHGDADIAAVETAFLNNSTLDFCFLSDDKAVSGARGPRATFDVANFSRGEPLEDGIAYDVTLRLVKFHEWEVVA